MATCSTFISYYLEREDHEDLSESKEVKNLFGFSLLKFGVCSLY